MSTENTTKKYQPNRLVATTGTFSSNSSPIDRMLQYLEQDKKHRKTRMRVATLALIIFSVLYVTDVVVKFIALHS